MALGAGVWSLGWHRVAERASLEDQRAPLNLAVAGVLVIGLGQALWFVTGRRRIRDRHRMLLGAAIAGLDDNAAAGPVGTADAGGQDRYLGTERYFHRPDCAMAAGRPWVPAARSMQLRANRVPCGMCAP
jgi:hypothetical protein